MILYLPEHRRIVEASEVGILHRGTTGFQITVTTNNREKIKLPALFPHGYAPTVFNVIAEIIANAEVCDLSSKLLLEELNELEKGK